MLEIPNVVKETKSETTFGIKLDHGDFDDDDDDDDDDDGDGDDDGVGDDDK